MQQVCRQQCSRVQCRKWYTAAAGRQRVAGVSRYRQAGRCSSSGACAGRRKSGRQEKAYMQAWWQDGHPEGGRGGEMVQQAVPGVAGSGGRCAGRHACANVRKPSTFSLPLILSAIIIPFI